MYNDTIYPMVTSTNQRRESGDSLFLLRALLALGGFGGVVVALLELLQGDVMLMIILPLALSLSSVILLFMSRIVRNTRFIRFLTVILYNFILFPSIWIVGHGYNGAAVLYYLVLIAIMVIIIERNDILILASLLFIVLMVSLVIWEPAGINLNRQYDSAYEQRYDYVFNMVLAAVILIAIIRVLYGRVRMLQIELEKTKTHDELTGLYNRRRILELLKAEQLRSSRERSDLCLVVLSVTNFSAAVRDLGHHSGEMLLKRVSYQIRNKSRLYDYLGRVNQSDFLCILPGSSREDGEEYIQRLNNDSDLFDAVYIDRGVELRGQAMEISNLSSDSVISVIDNMFRDLI